MVSTLLNLFQIWPQHCLFSLRLNQFTNSFTKTFNRKKASCDMLVTQISRIEFRHDDVIMMIPEIKKILG